MTEHIPQTPQQLALQQLLKADTDAMARREQARRQAAALVAEAEAAVEQLQAEMQTAAEHEAADYRAQAEASVNAELLQLRQDARHELAHMQRRAQSHRADAVAALINWVKAKD